MAKESEDSPKENFIVAEVPIQTKPMVVNSKENKVISDVDFQMEVLNKLDRILKSIG